MSKLEIKNLKIKEKSFKQINDNLKKIIKIMEEYDAKENAYDLLPKSISHEVKFELNNAYSGISNAIRRCLIAEIKVKCLDVDMSDIKTDDEFIISDALIKNINMIPISQDYESKELELYLYMKNNTNQMLDVYINDCDLYSDKKNKVQINLLDLIPETNIPIVKLSPNKFIQIKNFKIIEGFNKDNACKFTLLNNVSYKPLDVEPYDNFNKTGDKSINSNPKNFEISYITKANIEPKNVMIVCCNTLIDKLTQYNNIIVNYINNVDKNNFYGDDKIEVTRNDDYYIYKFSNEYLTLGNIIAQKIYLLDETVLYVSSTVERLDTEKMIIKIKHTEPDNILQDAIKSCINDFNDIKKYFE